MSLIVDIKKKLSNFDLDVRFEVGKDVFAILGASGSGKSMILKCISGIEKPDNGHIEYNGKVFFDSKKNINISSQKRNVGFLFQNYALFPNMTVEENIKAGIRDKKKSSNDVEIVMKKFLIGLICGILISSSTVMAYQSYVAYKNEYSVFVDGQESDIDGYNINGYTYFKLRDIGKYIGFNVDFKEGDIIINTYQNDINDLEQNYHAVGDLNSRLKKVRLSIEENSSGNYFISVFDQQGNILVKTINCIVIDDRIFISDNDYQKFIVPLEK